MAYPCADFWVLHARNGGQSPCALAILLGPGARRGSPHLALGIGLRRLPHHGASRRLSPSIRVPEDVPLPVLRDPRGSPVLWRAILVSGFFSNRLQARFDLRG